MGKIAYVEPRLIPLGKIEEWINKDVKTDTCKNDMGTKEQSDNGQNIDDSLLKVDMQRLDSRIRKELEK